MDHAGSGHAREKFFDLGLQYYVSGRFALHSRFLPVCGNLLHHCIEMFLKGALAPSTSLTELRNIGHELRALWPRFKTRINDARLVAFDSTIDDLDRFEKIRYPDRMLSEGAELTISITRAEIVRSEGGSLRRPPSYDLVLEEVDDLVRTIFELARVNPVFFTQRLIDDARHYLALDNAHQIPS